MTEYFLTASACSHYLGCDERTVRNYLANGKLRGRKNERGEWEVSSFSFKKLNPPAYDKWFEDALPDVEELVPDNAGEVEAYNRAKDMRPESVQKFADKWREILEESNCYRGTNALTEWCNWWNSRHPESKTSIKSIYRMRTLVERGGLVALLSDRHPTRVTTVNERFYQDFKNCYMRQQRQSINYCRDYALGCAIKRGEAISTGELLDEGEVIGMFPSAAAFRRRLEADYGKRFEKRSGIVLAKRYGAFKMNNAAGYHIERDYSGLLAGSVWVGDSRTIDVQVMHPYGYATRPVITLFIDMRTKMPMGWHVHLDGPSTNNTLRALRKGVEKFGVPDNLYLDNGKEYKNRGVSGYSISRICEKEIMTSFADLLHIKVTFAKVRNAQAKIIERLFLEMKNRIDRTFLSFTGGTTSEKPEQLKEVVKRGLLPSFEKFREIYDRAVGNIIPNVEMGGKILGGKSPVSLWNELIAERNKTNPMRMVSIETSSKLTSRYKYGRVQGSGFHLKSGNFEAWYWSDFMSHWKGRNVYLRYDPDDARIAWVYDEEKKLIGEAGIVEKVHAFADKGDAYSQEQIASGIARRHRDLKAVQNAVKVDRLTAEDILEAYSSARGSEQAIRSEGRNTLMTRHDRDSLEFADNKRKGKSVIFDRAEIKPEDEHKRIDLFADLDEYEEALG